jgi:hypothetical protein
VAKGILMTYSITSISSDDKDDPLQNMVVDAIRKMLFQLETEVAKYSKETGIPIEELEIIHFVGSSAYHARDSFKLEQEYMIRRKQ